MKSYQAQLFAEANISAAVGAAASTTSASAAGHCAGLIPSTNSSNAPAPFAISFCITGASWFAGL